MNLCEWCLYTTMFAEKAPVILPAQKDRKTVVQIANYLRSWGYTCKVVSILDFVFYVEVR